MLKIKAERMNELEKFGFEKFENGYSHKKYTHFTRFSSSAVWKVVVGKDRRLYINLPTIKTYDFLYDLIKADMVEKVEELRND